MGKKVKFKMKRGKLKVKLKSGDGPLPLSEGTIGKLLAFGAASAMGSGWAGEPTALPAGPEMSGLLVSGEPVVLDERKADPTSSDDSASSPSLAPRQEPEEMA